METGKLGCGCGGVKLSVLCKVHRSTITCRGGW